MKVTANKRQYKGFEIERNWAGYVINNNGQQVGITTKLKYAKQIIDKKIA